MAHRAYRKQHERTRAKLLPLAIGKPCPLCGVPMQMGMAWPLDLDHSDPAMKQLGLPGDRIVCAKCNRSRGDGSRTPAAPRHHSPSRDW